MTMQTVNYTKTLVIGLGSTGTQVCNELVKRIEWELGSLERAPWVNFLAIETNSGERSPLRRSGDFYTIGFNNAEYQNVLTNPRAYTELIDLETWADMNTLRKLPDPENGAGNIRMVGRLSLLYGDNYDRIRDAVVHRVERLRDLKEDQAQVARGALGDGSNPDIAFDHAGAVRVFVVGTLCGGTCSGLAPDFGYFLRNHLGRGKNHRDLHAAASPDHQQAGRPVKEKCLQRADRTEPLSPQCQGRGAADQVPGRHHQ